LQTLANRRLTGEGMTRMASRLAGGGNCYGVYGGIEKGKKKKTKGRKEGNEQGWKKRDAEIIGVIGSQALSAGARWGSATDAKRKKKK